MSIVEATILDKNSETHLHPLPLFNIVRDRDARIQILTSFVLGRGEGDGVFQCILTGL